MAWLPSSRTNYLERKWGDRSAPSRCLWNKPRFYWPSLLAKFEYIVLLLWLFPFDGLINLFSIVPSPLVAHFCNTQKADPKPFILLYIYLCIYMVTWCVYVCSPAPFLSLTLRQQLTSCWRHFALGRQQWRTFALYTHVCSVLSWALCMYGVIATLELQNPLLCVFWTFLCHELEKNLSRNDENYILLAFCPCFHHFHPPQWWYLRQQVITSNASLHTPSSYSDGCWV